MLGGDARVGWEGTLEWEKDSFSPFRSAEKQKV